VSTEAATLGGGCFWCLEAVFELLEGVERVESGYAGGSTPSPKYEEVCAGTTGHAEVVQVTFDPDAISYREILEVFFATHDPTTLNRQGPDVGTHYRSAIFHHTEAQKETAQDLIAELEKRGIFPGAIVTEVAELTAFHPAEAYHQEYYRNNPNQPYCTFLIDPKVAKFRQQFADRLSAAPPGG
jgi:peptide-methionine (S)-S-oxide reductase